MRRSGMSGAPQARTIRGDLGRPQKNSTESGVSLGVEMPPLKKISSWMRYAGMVASGNSRSSRSVDAVVYPRKSS